MDDFAIERVLLAVDLIPPGRVASYGDIGSLVGVGPRQVGAIMARFGGESPWWRVVNHKGELPQSLLAEALPHWDAEGIVLFPSGRGCSLSDSRVEADAWAAEYRAGLAGGDAAGASS